MASCFFFYRCASHMTSFSGDVQGETGQSNTSPSASTHPDPPHQHPPVRLCVLARAGLRGLGDVRPVPAAPRCGSLNFHSHRSHHFRLQPHGTISWIQPDGAAAEREGPGCGGDLAADVQDHHRSSPLTDSGFNLGKCLEDQSSPSLPRCIMVRSLSAQIHVHDLFYEFII